MKFPTVNLATSRIILFFSFLLLSVARSSAQSAETIISKHIKAIGGMKKVKKEKSIHTTGEIMSGAFSGSRIEMWSLQNTGLRVNLTRNDTTRSNIMYNQYSWNEVSPGTKSKPRKLPDQVWKNMDLDLAGELAEYQKKGNLAEYVGKENVENAVCYKIKLTSKSGKTTYYYFDTTTFFIIQSTVFAMKDGKETDLGTSRFGNYRKTGFGLIKPFELIQMVNGKVTGITKLNMIEVNSTINPSLFEIPNQ